MRTFYIFKVNKDYYNLTKEVPFNLYSAYLNIKLSTINNKNLLFNEFFSFTELINKNYINYYLHKKMVNLDGYTIFNNVHTYNNYYTDECSKLIVKSTYMILKSNNNNSTFLSYLNKIPNIFIIDFESQDYFWLSQISNLRLVYE